MDQDLKQRLVGAVVITSLAAIFVPMLFDDPIDETGKMISELKIPQAPGNSFNSNSAKLPKSINEVISLPKPKGLKALAAKPSANQMQKWFVQVGIFGQENNAITLQTKIRKQGFPVRVSTISTDKGLMYRVRIGPELDKKRAEKMKAKVDKLNNFNSMLSSVSD